MRHRSRAAWWCRGVAPSCVRAVRSARGSAPVRHIQAASMGLRLAFGVLAASLLLPIYAMLPVPCALAGATSADHSVGITANAEAAPLLATGHAGADDAICADGRLAGGGVAFQVHQRQTVGSELGAAGADEPLGALLADVGVMTWQGIEDQHFRRERFQRAAP